MTGILEILAQKVCIASTSQETSPNHFQPQSQHQANVQPSIFNALLEQEKADSAKNKRPLTIGQMIMQGSQEDEEKSK